MDAGGWRMLREAGREEWGGVMQLRLLDTPLAPDKPLWTSQAAYNKQAGCCRQAPSGRARGVGVAQVDVWRKNKIIQQFKFFWLVKSILLKLQLKLS